jgi:hypothetical protein
MVVFGVVESAFSGLLTGGFDPEATPSIATAVAAAVLSTIFTLVLSVISAPLTLTACADMRARREPFSTAYLAPVPAYSPPAA